MHRTLLTVAWSLLASVSIGADDRKIIEITFDSVPVEQGLAFERQHCEEAELTLTGTTWRTWRALSGSVSGKGWQRALRCKVTNPDFLSGKMPVVDIEITYHQSARAGTQVFAASADGFTQVNKVFGRTLGWRTLTTQVNNAHFGSADFDLMMVGANSDLYLQKIRIIGYNLDDRDKIHWPRLLGVKRLRSPHPANLLIFPRAASQHLTLDIHNLARINRPLRYTFQVSDIDGRTVVNQAGKFTVSAESINSLPLTLNTSDWRLGPYEARVDFYLSPDGTMPVLSRTIQLGVISDQTLDKAGMGEFLYGLDCSYDSGHPLTPQAFVYYRLMGVDLVRLWLEQKDSAHLQTMLEQLGAEQVQTLTMIDLPLAQDEAQRGADLVKLCSFLRDISAQHAGFGPGKLHYFELGNEPDLPFFHPLGIPDYLRSYHAMYDAIKDGASRAGLPNNSTCVMNGGLSFAGKEGPPRAEEFLTNVNPNKLDLLAYHAHGYGYQAEYQCFTRARDTAAKHGKGSLPLVDTESGFMGGGPDGRLRQAYTVVQKMTYAQSLGQPFFIFFRLFMQDGHEQAYGMTSHFQEPLPSVLAYRNMVAQLRHYRYSRALTFDNPALRGYVFSRPDANSHVAVLFATGQGEHAQQLDFAAATEVRLIDLFGNEEPLPLRGDTASLTLTERPIYLRWQAAGQTAHSSFGREADPVGLP